MLKEYINESIHSKVFRYESLGNFYNTIRSNKFFTSLAFGNVNSTDNKNFNYYLSTFRSRSNKFIDILGDFGVIMTLDGNKFNNNFKGAPVNYWKIGPTYSESEDRIFTNKSYVENAMSYIQSVDILFGSRSLSLNPSDIKQLKEILISLDFNNIPFYVYDDIVAFKNSNKSKSIKNLDEIFDKPIFEKERSDEYLKSEEEIKAHRDIKLKTFTAALEIAKLSISEILFDKNNEEKIIDILNEFSASEQERIKRFFNRFYFKYGYTESVLDGLRSDIFNYKKDTDYRDAINNFVEFLRKNKISSFEDLYKKISDKIK